MQPSTAHRLIWGLLIIVVGVVFLLNQLGFVTIDVADLFSTYWPVILILFGLQGLSLQHRGGVLWNGIMILIGCYFLGSNLGYVHWDFSDFIRILLPLAIILFGLNMIFRGGGSKRRASRDRDRRDGWNPVHPEPPAEPRVPPGPPPAPPELDDFERRNPSIDLSKNAGSRPSGDDYRHDSYGGAVPPPPGHEEDRGWKKSHGHKERWHHNDWWNHQDWHKSHGHSSCKTTHSRFIGDAHFGQDYWELKPMSISHFIGDTSLDLTKAQIPLGETRVYVSSFIGDVKVFVPNDLSVGIQVVSSCLIGDVKVLDQKRGGLFNQMSVETPQFRDSDKRVVLVVSCFIGDVRVTKVG